MSSSTACKFISGSFLQLTFNAAHFFLDQIDGECLDRCGFSGFDVDNFQQSGQVLLARFQGVAPARAALDLIEHGLRPDEAAPAGLRCLH